MGGTELGQTEEIALQRSNQGSHPDLQSPLWFTMTSSVLTGPQEWGWHCYVPISQMRRLRLREVKPFPKATWQVAAGPSSADSSSGVLHAGFQISISKTLHTHRLGILLNCRGQFSRSQVTPELLVCGPSFKLKMPERSRHGARGRSGKAS